jgi:chemotaxis protein MotB
VDASAGAFPSNWELAAARASNVAKILAANGIPQERLVVVSYGDTRPTALADSAEAKSESRRVGLAILPSGGTATGETYSQR